MSSVVTELDQFDASVIVPDDGDTSGAASVTAAGVGFQPLANRTKHLQARNIGSAGGNLQLDLNAVLENTSARFGFSFGVGAPNFTWGNIDTTTAGGIYFMVPPMFGVQITNVVARYHGDGFGAGAHGAVPGTLPTVALQRLDTDDGGNGSVSTIGTFTDPSATVGAYETLHDIDLSGLTAVAGDDAVHVVRITGETGANAIDGRGVLYRVYLTLAPV